jgi:TRAP-type C4-dicarboxylate transport system substrate-binding protein
MRWLIGGLLLTLVGAQVKIRVGSTVPTDSPWEEALDTYIKEVHRRVGPDKLTFRKYLGGQLGGEIEMARSLRLGTLDMAVLSLAGLAEGLGMPELQVLEMPFLFESNEEVDYVLSKMFPELDRRLQEKGVVLILLGVNGWRNFGSRERPILSPSDLKGLKMRAQEAAVYTEMYKALGATPIPLPTPEVLLALKNKMVDGFDQTVVFAMATGWMQQIKHYTLTQHIYQAGAIVMSKKVFDKLSPDLQAALRISDKRAEIEQIGLKLVRDEEQSILASIEKEGQVKIYRLSPQQREAFRKAVQSAYPKIEAAVGPEGKKLLSQVQAALAEYRRQKKATPTK